MDKVWFAQFHVAPRKNNDLLPSDALGAYVNVIALSDGYVDFINDTSALLNKLEFNVIGYEKLKNIITVDLDDSPFLKQAANLTPKNWLIFDTFHSYGKDSK